MDIFIKDWKAISGSISENQQWTDYFANPSLFDEVKNTFAELAILPAMQRRRLSAFAKLALAPVIALDPERKLPSIFSSQHGDLMKTSALLDDIAGKQELSPTRFSLSVHNAASGLYGIYTNNRQPSTAIAAGNDTLHMAVIEAYGQLMSGDYSEIIVIYTENTIPIEYEPFIVPVTPISIALRLSLKQGNKYTLDYDLSQSSENSNQALDLVRYLISSNTKVTIDNRWFWSKIT